MNNGDFIQGRLVVITVENWVKILLKGGYSEEDDTILSRLSQEGNMSKFFYGVLGDSWGPPNEWQIFIPTDVRNRYFTSGTIEGELMTCPRGVMGKVIPATPELISQLEVEGLLPAGFYEYHANKDYQEISWAK